MAACKDLLLQAVEQTISKVNDGFKIKPKQLEAIKNIVEKKDTLAILPTSYGKSLIYQMLPSVCTTLGLALNPFVIVISPLKSLIQDQLSAASNLKCIGLLPSSLSNIKPEELITGKKNLLIDTPEAWLDDQQWCNLLSTKFCRNNLICIVIDEAHLVSWGVPSEDSEKAFREAFSRINTIRSFCGEHVPILALSATVDKDISHLISSLCGMSRKLCTIFTSSDRKNIKLSMVNIKSKNIDCFRWVLDQVRLLKEECPKISIYCRTQTLVGWLFEKFIFSLKNEAYTGRGTPKTHGPQKPHTHIWSSYS